MTNKLNHVYAMSFVGLIISLALSVEASSERPNFLLLFPDQWRFDWTPNPSLPNLQMPAFSSLQKKGTHFSHAFVPSPLCAPSRSCLAGGREYDFAGVPDNFSNDYPLNKTTFYTILKTAGYNVMTTGKDDLTKATGCGIDGSTHASALGFSQWARCEGKEDAAGSTPHDPYGAWCSQQSEVVNGKNLSFWEIYNADMKSCTSGVGAAGGYDCQQPSPLPQEAYEDDWVAEHAIGLLANKPAGVPWFLQVSFPGPHPPFVVTGGMMNATAGLKFPDAFDNPTLRHDVQQTVRRDYAAELMNLDGLFARVIAALSPAELANTYIMVGSDHGEMLGDHATWGKTMPWQGSVSVPLVILGPELPAGATVGDPVSTMDIAGTVLDFAGLAPDTANGMTTVSLRPFLSPSPNASAYRTHVSSGLSSWRAVVVTRESGMRLKLVCCRGRCPGQPGNATHPAEGGFVGDSGEDEDRYPSALLGEGGSGKGRGADPTAPNTLLLFDIDADPFDMQDISKSKPDAVRAMTAMLPTGWCGA